MSGYRTHRIDESTCPFPPPYEVRALRDAADDEPARPGAGPGCPGCAVPEDAVIWCDEHWRLRSKPDTSIPGTVILETRAHLDSFSTLSPGHLAGLGPLLAAIEASLLELDGVARVHMSRWGDGSEHFHLYCYPRPRGRLQLRGTFLAVWELLLPPAPPERVRSAERRLAAGLNARTGR